jgi:hypothetical protein
MADDALTRFAGKLIGWGSSSSATPPPEPAPSPDLEARTAYEAYEPFENEVRTTNVEIRCHASGFSYFIPYAHLGVIVFNFRTGARLFLTGGGYAVTIRGRNLRAIVMALRLHSCATIQDFTPDVFILPQPQDPAAPFVESIAVEVLTAAKPTPPPENKEPR